MRFRRRKSPLLLLLLSTSIIPAYSEAVQTGDLSADSPTLKLARAAEAVPLPQTRANPIGTEHAPVDGKDGMPHEGPFVETSAERSRKKNPDEIEDQEIQPLKTSIAEKFGDVDLPTSNEGVMDDRTRSGPVDGTRGTEGGVSEKSKETKLLDKKPDAPKEAPPSPHSEAEKVRNADDSDGEAVGDDKKFLAKPSDLPAKPHNIPHPENPSSPKDNGLISNDRSPSLSSQSSVTLVEESAVIQPLHSLLLSFTMILFSEIGDKTFLVAALMAMRHDRIVVFTAAYFALVTMTVLSAVLGHAVPTLIPKSVTNFLAAGLFLVFGIKMVLEARQMTGEEGVSEEMKEVEMELEEKEHQQRRMSRRRSSISPYVLESGRGVRKARSTTSRLPSPPESPSSSSSREGSPSRQSTVSNILAGMNNLLSFLLSPAWVQTFVMTFLGEWGDRSQIATIAMAAGQDYWWVTGGALGGHAICTAAAVLGGKAIAGKVSLKAVTMGGAIAFLVFGVIYLFEAIY